MNYNNLAQSTNFIAGSDKFENIPFFLTMVNIPGMSIQHSQIGGRGGAQINVQGNTMTFNPLSIEMLIDEDFKIYKEVMSIIRKNVNLDNGTFDDFYFDFFIEVNNNKGNKVLKLEFRNCRIESISDVLLNTQDDGTEYTMTIDLVYDYYEIEKPNPYTLPKISIETPPEEEP